MPKVPLITKVLGVSREQVEFICSRALLKRADGEIPEIKAKVISNFFDSGAFSIGIRTREWSKETGLPEDKYYDSEEFLAYANGYVQFLKDHKEVAQHYANIDVIGNPKLTWKNQKLLESLGINPVPVVHFGTDLKWLKKYVSAGYTYIGLGGLVGGRVGGSASPDKNRWIASCFAEVCPAPTYLPSVRFHGFGVSTWRVIRKYPWYSVDSAAWAKLGAFGNIMVPRKRRGEWDFSGGEEIVSVSKDSPSRHKADSHYFTMTLAEREMVNEWLEEVCVPLGRLADSGETEVEGVLTNGYLRRIAVLYTCELFRKHLPPWKRPFVKIQQTGLGLL